MNIDKVKIDNNKKYLENHNITQYFEEMMSSILKNKPNEPLSFMIKFIQKKAAQNGIKLSFKYKAEKSESPNIKRSNDFHKEPTTSKSSEKPNVSEVIKKEGKVNGENNDNLNQKLSMINYKMSVDENVRLNDEFRLVSETVVRNSDDLNSESRTKPSKSLRNSSKTKQYLSKLIDEENQAQLKQRNDLEQNKKTGKEIIDYDSAVELFEDTSMYMNEFSVQLPSDSKSVKAQTGIVIKKEIVPNFVNGDESLKFGICINCAKFYKPESVPLNSERNWNELKESLIIDDLESASQVNGPRLIDEDYDFKKNRPKSQRKKISVSDFGANSKAWPVFDTSSESSVNRTAKTKLKLSSRHFVN